ncbi:helix-turn-helix domain-containing protein [Shigella dysenteriae]|uniref:transcriptional regulator n=1 Tax=Escherichia coli TaxID=562 RepID=UPI000E032BF0|nr:YdaS family helix-turn-helix protein [Escherichia coli]EFP6908591.1 helix-turn-helix domain-containing protein [Shigella dysenteriae]EFL5716744.1 helix-turn-helix domain-containing protein [Escherichia coli]EFP7033411.1 helix-turn-helix domain-containing protein [Shigella dysenteriae]EFW3898094.1 helix-turn-helix domain-containing protein [Shigella dysenteriae]MCX3825163.1 helix-turn-helix domain-containing protein [Escherichia coli]
MTPEQLALKEAINAAGGQSELARKLTVASGKDVKQQQVWNWLHREKRPPIKQSQNIERITGVPKERLRPDVFQKSTDPAV